jgi:hypothetical protein
MDHWFQPTATRITRLTVFVYFNDDFGGGETRFMEQVECTIVPLQNPWRFSSTRFATKDARSGMAPNTRCALT